MTIHFRPAKRENTPVVVGLAGPTKSGKTYSAHRLAIGLAQGGTIAMINTEGAKGHQYADRFDYIATDLEAPFRPQRYTEALQVALALEPRPAVVVIDSLSHMHDGPGGILEWHEEELDRLAGDDRRRRERNTWTAWIKPKAAENEFIYSMLGADCHLILCFRAKEKIKIVTGKQPIPLGWQPIAGERVAFETIFTLVLPPHSKGVPDLAVSDMREPFDSLIPANQPLDEKTGAELAKWAAGASAQPSKIDARVVELVRDITACADKIGNRDAVNAAISTNRRAHQDDPAKHLAWLEATLKAAQTKVAEAEAGADADPFGEQALAGVGQDGAAQ